MSEEDERMRDVIVSILLGIPGVKKDDAYRAADKIADTLKLGREVIEVRNATEQPTTTNSDN